jgi:dipeptidyl-peptidase-4
MRHGVLFSALVLLPLVACGAAPSATVAAPTPSSSTVATPSAALVPAPPVVDREFIHALSESRWFTRGSPVAARVTPDGHAVLFLRSQPRDTTQSLFETDVATGTTRELLSPDILDKGPEHLTQEERARRERLRITSNGFTSYAISDDGRTVIVVLSGKLYAFDRASGKTHLIDVGHGAAIDPRLSPDGKLVAYVQDDDVHVASVDGTGNPRAVTKGGTDTKPHGLADFIAAEELDRARGFWWSPDSRSILFEEADATGVEVLTIADPAHPETPADRVPYPRPGHANATLRFGIATLGGTNRWVEWDRAQYPYVAQVGWSKNAPASLVVFDRLQKNELVLLVDEKTGATREAMREHDDGWRSDDPSVPRWLPDGSAFLWTSERDGDWRLGLVPTHDAASTKWLTPKGAEVEAVLDVDGAKRTATYEATSDGLHHRVMHASLDGGDSTVVAKIDDGDVYAAFTDGQHDIFMAREVSMSGVDSRVNRSIDGRTLHEIPSLAETPTLPRVEHEDVGPDAVHVSIVRPRSYVPGARYAVIDSAYGGPHAQVVTVNPRDMLLAQWMADATGAIVVSLDAKGTPGRGHAWERVLAGKLADVPLDGHIDTLRALVAAHPEMDGARIGIYGWSFGGTCRPWRYFDAPTSSPPGFRSLRSSITATTTRATSSATSASRTRTPLPTTPRRC